MARVYLKGLPQLKAKLIRLKEDTREPVAAAMGRAADLVVAQMKRLVPKDEGKLRDSIGWTFGEAPKGAIKVVTASKGNFRITIFAGNEEAFYARWVEFGTRAHMIKAKNAKALGKDGRMGKEVSHPGGRARPFFFPSYRASKKEMKRMVRKAIQDAVREAVR